MMTVQRYQTRWQTRNVYQMIVLAVNSFDIHFGFAIEFEPEMYIT